MKFLFLLFFSICVFAQTQVPGSQVKSNLNVTVSPIASVERWTCNAFGTNPDGSKWDCRGFQAIRIILVDGTVIGPFALSPIALPTAADTKWVSIPLTQK